LATAEFYTVPRGEAIAGPKIESKAVLLYMYSRRKTMLAVRLDKDLEERLERLAAKTGRTKTFYAREAIEAHLDDLEDFFLAEERLRDFRSEDAIPLAEVEKRLGLDD
jgi:RHH-type rel operon transcriptional repressor/antitoxin RelB